MRAASMRSASMRAASMRAGSDARFAARIASLTVGVCNMRGASPGIPELYSLEFEKSFDTTWSRENSGFSCKIRATAPATKGVAIEVPESTAVLVLFCLPADKIASPGA